MEQAIQIERELAEVKELQASHGERIKTLFNRIEQQDEMVKSVNALALSVRDLTNEQKCLQGTVAEMRKDVETIKAKPGKRWDSVVDKIIMAVVAALAGFVLAKLGL